MNITGDTGLGWSSGLATTSIGSTGSFYVKTVNRRTASAGGVGNWDYHLNIDASLSWSGSTSTASINTNALGSGSAISNLPSFITVKMWRRLS